MSAQPAALAGDSSIKSTPASIALLTSVGVGFRDADFGFNTRDGRMAMTTATFSAQTKRVRTALVIGDLVGHFLNADGLDAGTESHLLLEWTTEGTIWKGGSGSAHVDLFGAAMLTRNEAAGVDARQLGVGGRLGVGAKRLGGTVFYRRIVGESADVRARVDWSVPMEVSSLRLRLTGYQDLVFGPRRLPETSGFPALYASAGALFGTTRDAAELGIRVFDHRSAQFDTTAPQLAVRFVF